MRVAGPSLPSKGRAANAASTLGAPDSAQPLSSPPPHPPPAAKPNTHMSEAALLCHRTGQATAENTLQEKKTAPGPKKSKYLINLRKGQKGDECARAVEEREGKGEGGRDGGR